MEYRSNQKYETLKRKTCAGIIDASNNAVSYRVEGMAAFSPGIERRKDWVVKTGFLGEDHLKPSALLEFSYTT